MDALPVKFGGFLDTYYAFDFNQPKNHERAFTTQPVKHNEFNINLAYFDATLKKETTRARVALQWGTSVEKNTRHEPDESLTIFQEAYVGKRVGEKSWIDGGIFFGNIGAESWISKDNWTYSRALNLDYVPYYSAGVRLEHHLNEEETFQFQVLNGWQIYSENNQSKALAMQYKKGAFTYNNFFGDEEVVSPKPRFRGYHNFIFQWLPNDAWGFLGAIDFGHQSQQTNDGVDGWFATSLTIRRKLNEKESLAFRMEYYADPHQANVLTNTPNGFQVTSASMNYDQKLDENSLWRTELRGYKSKDEIYPEGSHSKNDLDGFIVTSLSFWF